MNYARVLLDSDDNAVTVILQQCVTIEETAGSYKMLLVTNHLIFTGGGGTSFEMMHAIFFRGPLYANNFFGRDCQQTIFFLENFWDESMAYFCGKRHDVQ